MLEEFAAERHARAGRVKSGIVACYGLEDWIQIVEMSSIRHDYVVRGNSWQFRPWIISLLSAHSSALIARLAQNNLAARAESRSQLPQSSQPGVQLFQAPAVLGSHSSMQQPCHLCRGLAVLAAAAAAVAAMPSGSSRRSPERQTTVSEAGQVLSSAKRTT
jgi:hypothetical protein